MKRLKDEINIAVTYSFGAGITLGTATSNLGNTTYALVGFGIAAVIVALVTRSLNNVRKELESLK